MYAFFINMINALIRGLGAVLTFSLALLPNSPFQAFIVSDSTVVTYLKFLNYIFPVITIIAIYEAYLVAVGLFNIVQVVLRWLKFIE